MARRVKRSSGTTGIRHAWLMPVVATACTLCGFAPLAISLGSIGIAKAAGCRLTEADVGPCMVMGTDIGNSLYGGAMMFWLFFLTAPIAFAAVVLWGIILVSFLRRRIGRGRSGRDRQEADPLAMEWKSCGRLVLQDDDDPRDHDAIDRWIMELIDRPSGSPEDDHIRSLVYHSLNFDIPFAATRNVRERLMDLVRKRLVEDGGIPSGGGVT